MTDVSLVKGVVRYDNVMRALHLIQDDIEDKIENGRNIIIKPDLLHINGCNELELTNIDTVKAILDFFEEFTNKKVKIAEGSFSTEDVFHHHYYHDLLKDYSVKFLNMNNEDSTPVEIGKTALHVSNTLLGSDLRISVAVLKRDPKTGILAAIPNICVGGLNEKNKDDFYKSKTLNKQLPELYKLLRPHISVIDGFDAIKTEAKIKFSSAIASSEAIASDMVASKVLGVATKYLHNFSPQKVDIVT